MYITPRDRAIGSLLGLHVGDSLGAPYETWDKVRIETDFAARNGLHFFDYAEPWHGRHTLPAGRPTDDSDQAAALAESLIANRGVSQSDIYQRLRLNVYGHVSPLWEGKAFGAGKTTRTRLKPLTWDEARTLDISNELPSNGCLMRAAPLALLFDKPETLDISTIQQATTVTHRHPLALKATVAFLRVLTRLLSGMDAREALLRTYGDTEDRELRLMFNRVAHRDPWPKDPGAWPARGDALLTLEIALCSVSSVGGGTFTQGMRDVIAIGGDTDTYAAVAGALLGARDGWQGIPPSWLLTIKGGKKMCALAEELYDMQIRTA